MKKLWGVLFLLFFSIGGVFAEEADRTVINITNARQTSYKKDDATGNDVIVLEGDVQLTVTKGSTSSEIKADTITYDRKTEMLYAEGNVEITTKSSAAGGETTTADSLLMNTGTLEGVFDGGRVVQTQSDALNLPSGSTLIVFSDLFGKTENNTIAFKNSSLTFCDDEDPHWHIDATRTWLLPGGEFAFFNAFLYVGVVPVLYLPAFYYPKDELIFNPVFGYKKREGTYFQTTTYLYGRKPLDSSDSDKKSESESSSAESLKALYNFMKPSSLKEQKREGLVLHNLDEDYTGNTTNYVKVMGDWYSNLGAMVGVDGNFQPSSSNISKINFNTYLGFSNTVFKNYNGDYVPFHTITGDTYKDGSNFMGMKTDFLRYGANFDFVLSKPFRLSLALPIYSDPYFSYDFKNRQETMDWISYFIDNTKNDTAEPSISEVSSFTWKLSTSYSPNLPAVVKPYINSLSVSLDSSVNISSAKSTFTLDEYYDSVWAEYTPSRKFYYPSQVTPASASFSLSGTIFQWPIAKKSAKATETPQYVITLNKPDEIMTSAERKKAEEGDGEKTEEGEKIEENQFFEFTLPALEFSPVEYEAAKGVTYSLNYSIASNFSSQLAYSSTGLNQADDFDWNEIKSSMYTVKLPLSLASKFNYGGNYFGVENKLTFDPVWQKHPEISKDTTKGGYTESAAKSLILADYKAETRNLNNTNTISYQPFYYTEHFSDTGIKWNTNFKLYRRTFTGDADNPKWEVLDFDWDDEDCVTKNSVDYILGASEYNKKIKQTLTFTTILPPQLRQYNAALNLVFPYVSASVSTGYKETSKDPGVTEEDKWIKNPLQQSLSVSLFNSSLKLTQSYTYNLEEEYHSNLKFSAGWKGLNLSYVMQYTQGADLIPGTGWVNRVDENNSPKKEFLPYSLSFSYSTPSKTYYKWFNRVSIAPGLNTSIVADFIKPTNSYLIFSPSLSFKINEFFNLTFSSTSRNSILYWYFNEGMYDEWGGFPGNIFKDLIDSFRFDDESLRSGSGFKLKSLNMTMSHELHDWKFNMTMKIEPRIITENNTKRYDFSPYITIGIVWNPMESMKTEIVDEYGEWKLQNN